MLPLDRRRCRRTGTTTFRESLMLEAAVPHRMRSFACLPIFFAAAAFLVGCAAGPIGPKGAPVGTPVGAPAFLVGDHWQYRVTDELARGAQSQLDIEVVSVEGNTATMRSTMVDAYGKIHTSDIVLTDGNLKRGNLLYEAAARTFPEPLQLVQFPLQSGSSWRQTLSTTSPETSLPAQILLTASIAGRNSVTVPAGSYDAVVVRIILQLDDAQFFRTRTSVYEDLGYSTDVRGLVKMTRRAEYFDRNSGGGAPARHEVERSVTELVSFRPGA